MSNSPATLTKEQVDALFDYIEVKADARALLRTGSFLNLTDLEKAEKRARRLLTEGCHDR